MTITLYPDQQALLDDVRRAMRRHRRVLAQLPTGGGKTAVASVALLNTAAKGGQAFFIVHRQELLDQTAKTMDKVGLPYSFIAAEREFNPYRPIQICSIDTLKNRYQDLTLHPKVIVIDECHHAKAAGWERVLRHYHNSYHLGLSATPCRLDGKPLNDHFDTLVSGPSLFELIRDGRLNGYRMYAPCAPDLTGVRKVAGDYTRKQAAERMTRTITGNAVEHYKKLAAPRRAVAFCCSVEHAYDVCTRFNMAGIPAECLTGRSTREERKRVLRDYAAGTLQVICNVDLFGEGFDLSAAADCDVQVGCVISLRPTDSLSLWLQQCGRALRLQDRHSVILDHAGNCLAHGLPDAQRTWTLEGGPVTESSGASDAEPVRQCPQCYHCHKPLPNCPECGHTYQAKPRKVKEVDGELSEVDAEKLQARKEARQEQGQAESYESLLAIEKARGYKPGWARHVYNARQAKRMMQ